MQRGKQTL